MSDMTLAIQPRSDQQNSDDFITGPRTITITRVEVKPSPEQPVSVFFEGDDGKPWRPCKSTSRLLVAAWGPDSAKYVGKSLTLYRDPKVTWGGMEVGGIRISHMSGLERPLQMALTASKKTRAMVTVQPLKDATKPRQTPLDAPTTKLDPAEWAADFAALIDAATDADELERAIVQHLGEPGAPMKDRPTGARALYAADKEHDRFRDLAAKASDRAKVLRGVA